MGKRPFKSCEFPFVRCPEMERMRQQRVRDFYQGWLPFSLCFAYDIPFFKTNQQPLQRKETERLHLIFWASLHFFTFKCMLIRQYMQLSNNNNNNNMTMKIIREAMMISGLTNLGMEITQPVSWHGNPVWPVIEMHNSHMQIVCCSHDMVGFSFALS